MKTSSPNHSSKCTDLHTNTTRRIFPSRRVLDRACERELSVVERKASGIGHLAASSLCYAVHFCPLELQSSMHTRFIHPDDHGPRPIATHRSIILSSEIYHLYCSRAHRLVLLRVGELALSWSVIQPHGYGRWRAYLEPFDSLLLNRHPLQRLQVCLLIRLKRSWRAQEGGIGAVAFPLPTLRPLFRN
jgi:hypothetical protein